VVRKIVILLSPLILGLGIGMVVGMTIMIGWILICIAMGLIPVGIWGDRWLMESINLLRTKLNKENAWLFNLVSRQSADLGDYLFTVVHKIGYSNLTETQNIRIYFELLNLTVFTLDITGIRVHAECNGYEIGPEVTDLTEKRQVWGQRKQYNFEYLITNKEFLIHLKQTCLTHQRLNWTLRVTWDLQTALSGRKIKGLEHKVNFVEVPDLSPKQIGVL
jgi:hypothetical protein